MLGRRPGWRPQFLQSRPESGAAPQHRLHECQDAGEAAQVGDTVASLASILQKPGGDRGQGDCRLVQDRTSVKQLLIWIHIQLCDRTSKATTVQVTLLTSIIVNLMPPFMFLQGMPQL